MMIIKTIINILNINRLIVICTSESESHDNHHHVQAGEVEHEVLREL